MEIELASLLVKRDYTYEDLKAVFDRPEARFFLFHFVFDFCVLFCVCCFFLSPD